MIVVYTLIAADDTVLYIGQTYNLAQRLRSHRSKPWWPQVARVRAMDASGGARHNDTDAWSVEGALQEIHRPVYAMTPTQIRRRCVEGWITRRANSRSAA